MTALNESWKVNLNEKKAYIYIWSYLLGYSELFFGREVYAFSNYFRGIIISKNHGI